MQEKKIIELKDIAVSFDGEPVLKNLNLSISDGEFVTLLGPSGCGKTTTLRIIAGFVTPDTGDVFFEGKRVNDLPAYRRPVNTIFQRYALFPHLNVYENVAFGMRVQKKSNAEIEETVTRMLELVNLKGFEKRSVAKLSGGQQQRVAIARTLATNPDIILLDEPISALDVTNREIMKAELKALQKKFNVTMLFITHDQEEAFFLSDRIMVMDQGNIEQLGTPLEIYREPASDYVRSFVVEQLDKKYTDLLRYTGRSDV